MQSTPKVFVSGLPFLLQGWNKGYLQIALFDTYISHSYILYPWLLWIIGGINVKSARLRKDEGKGWLFEVSHGLNQWVIGGQKINGRADSPIGLWKLDYGFTRTFEVSETSKARF